MDDWNIPSVEEITAEMKYAVSRLGREGPDYAICARVAHDMMTKMAPGKRMMIEGMNKEDIRSLVCAVWIKDRSTDAVADEIHRLANTPAPAPEVDPSFEKAKELFMLAYPSISDRDEAALKLGISAARMMDRGA